MTSGGGNLASATASGFINQTAALLSGGSFGQWHLIILRPPPGPRSTKLIHPPAKAAFAIPAASR